MMYICFVCGGDGRDTCTNPDHGFINGVGGEIGRLGCPCCGHDENHKIPNGGKCEHCNGKGLLSQRAFNKLVENFEYDDEPEMYITPFKRRRFPKLNITDKEISGTYKGKDFNIFPYGLDNIYYREGEKRYNIDVIDLKSGMYDVQTYETCENIIEALEIAVKGAMI